MTYDEAIGLLRDARSVLERHMFDENGDCWDDIAEICMKIDDNFPATTAQEVLPMTRASDRAA